MSAVYANGIAYHLECTQSPYAQKSTPEREMSALKWFFRRPPANGA